MNPANSKSYTLIIYVNLVLCAQREHKNTDRDIKAWEHIRNGSYQQLRRRVEVET
jgi:hypothetical protein